ncbi:MAG TPA: FeoA family protein [Ramlibacter sp.]|uniref:FeoA family protein n=1 Tax=Ramlibacter sp. TaxID=1917967 RepID=UPI002CC063D0|nr:FeoA family protein [Ramlibacter sp.]HVZ42815.1 FeoA family protein [Ramlibacter sp.]
MTAAVEANRTFQSGPLRSAPCGTPCVVRRVVAPAANPELKSQLEDIGFLPGEPVLVTMRGFPGDDPLAVRVGQSTFALRAAEAACIEVESHPK